LLVMQLNRRSSASAQMLLNVVAGGSFFSVKAYLLQILNSLGKGHTLYWP